MRDTYVSVSLIFTFLSVHVLTFNSAASSLESGTRFSFGNGERTEFYTISTFYSTFSHTVSKT
jgi:hypothetical protein